MKQWYLIYDDNCAICNRGVEQIKRLDKSGLVKLIPLSKSEQAFDFDLPDKRAMREEMHLIAPDRKIYKGAEAVARVASIFPESKLIGNIISMPLVRPLARLIYSLIAKNRMKLSKVVS